MPATKIFYSWQSDLPNSSNRGFIQKALENVAKGIRNDAAIELDPVIDRDTLEVPGSPNIAATILNKIDQAQIFVCDVSTINSESPTRPSPNPNVLFELGYAVAKLGTAHIIMVLNSAFGGVEGLPFDLRLNRVITYHLLPSDEDKASVRKELEKSLNTAIRIVLLQIEKEHGIAENERTLTRLLISQEIDYNLSCLSEIYNRVTEEEAKYKATFKQDGMGGWTAEGDPIQALTHFHPSVLSQAVWESQMKSAASALTREEIAEVMKFYGSIKGIAASQEKFMRHINSRSDSPLVLVIAGQLKGDVISKIAATVKNHPALS